MKTSQNILLTSDLSIGFPGNSRTKNILQNNLSLGLKTGELTCLLGPNGCGKSTLIRTLSGFQKPLGGIIKIFDRSLAEMNPSEISKMVSISLTEPVDVGNMTVFAVVAFGRSPYTGFLGKLNDSDFGIIEKSLENAGICHLHNRLYNQLSDGEKQKVMIAKSLAQETQLMFLDEPTAFLDFPGKIEILQLLRDTAWKQQKAILLTVHDLNLALKFADKIWLMGTKMPVITGVPEDLILNDVFGKYFNTEKTRFDIASGSFSIKAEKHGNVMLKGAGLKFDWLVKALQRKGFTILTSDIGHSDIPFIFVNEENDMTFELIANGSVYKANSIEKLLEKLNSFEIEQNDQ